MPVRVESTMSAARGRVYGPLPAHRDEFDPTGVLQATGTDNTIIVLDSDRDLPSNWREIDLVSLMNPPDMTNPQPGTDTDGGTPTEVNIFLFFVVKPKGLCGGGELTLINCLTFYTYI